MRILPPVNKEELYELIKISHFPHPDLINEQTKKSIDRLINDNNAHTKQILNSLDKEQLYKCYTKWLYKEGFGEYYNELAKQYRDLNEDREIQ